MARVLVVDDEPRITSFVSRALSAEGFQVDAAADGRRGLELARTGRYSLVVLDLLLPGMDGVHVLSEINSAGFAPEADPIVPRITTEALDVAADEVMAD